MFFIFSDLGFIINSDLKGQFEPFQIGKGKLPSFSFVFHKLTSSTKDKISEGSVIGDYTFYKRDSSGFWLSFGESYMCIDKSFSKATVYLSNSKHQNTYYEASYLLMQGYMYRLVSTGNFMIHSAAVVYKNNAILFCGVSGAGKSTQANLWKKYLHCSILNYDKPCIIHEADNVYAHGSPWSGKEKLFLNEYAPLKAIVYVVQSKTNTVRRSSPAEAMSHIYLHNYVYPLNKEIEDMYLSIVKKTAERVPVYELSCNISENAVEVLYNTLFTNAVYEEAKKEFVMKYKVKDCFIMKRIADEYIVMPRGTEAISFNASVVFNETGAFLWNKLTEYIDKEALSHALQEKYQIDDEIAKKDTALFIEKMLKNGLIEELTEGA